MKKQFLLLSLIGLPFLLSATFAKYAKGGFMRSDINMPLVKDSVFKGKMSIKKMPEGWLSVTITDPSLAESRLFILQSDTQYDIVEKETSGTVRYFSSPKRVEMAFENSKMTFALAKNSSDDAKTTYYGYGLIKMKGSKESFVTYHDGDEKVKCDCRAKDSADKDCTAGGEGATACSLSFGEKGCSVDCSDRPSTFACCFEE
jgi:hypothetical protein